MNFKRGVRTYSKLRTLRKHPSFPLASLRNNPNKIRLPLSSRMDTSRMSTSSLRLARQGLKEFTRSWLRLTPSFNGQWPLMRLRRLNWRSKSTMWRDRLPRKSRTSTSIWRRYSLSSRSTLTAFLWRSGKRELSVKWKWFHWERRLARRRKKRSEKEKMRSRELWEGKLRKSWALV